MELRILKHVYITPWIRLNLYTKGWSLSLGHRRMGWITVGPRGIRGTLDTPVSGIYLSESRSWKDLTRPRP
jgi:hypothetical protein